MPDYNAWLQPVGDPSLFDPSCFRLIGTRTLLVVKRSSGNPDYVVVAEDELYFTNLPPDNNGGVGLVIYEFMPLRSGCTSTLTPYQAVASGRDNEKFNGDYGATAGGLLSTTDSSVTLDKEVDPTTANAGDALDYTISFSNDGVVPVGQPDLGLPIVIQDAIPAGSVYVTGTAEVGNTLPEGVVAYQVFYSTDGGSTWLQTEPVPASNVTHLQWWLSDPLAVSASGNVTFSVQVNDPAPPVIYNVAGLSLGNTVPFREDDATTLITGLNEISGTVFEDTGDGVGGIYGNGVQDGDEPGIEGVTVYLFYDSGSGLILFATVETDEFGFYEFIDLPNGNYIVQLDPLDPAVPAGYTITAAEQIPVTLADDDATDVDFGFAPGLELTKTGPAWIEKNEQIVYHISISNLNASTGPGPTLVFTNWSQARNTTYDLGTDWQNQTNAVGDPNEEFAVLPVGNNNDRFGLTSFGPNHGGNVTNVKVVVRGYATTPNNRDRFIIISYTNGAPASAGIELIEYEAPDFPSANSDLILDVTTLLPSLSWSSLTNLSIGLEGYKTGGPDDSIFYIDAVGLIFSFEGPVGVLETVPLYDYYDPNILEFVSAIPPVTTADSGGPAPNTGRLFWENVGPIAPEQGTNITVTFDVIGPPGNAGVITTNRALITNAVYNTGAPANEAGDSAVSEMPATGSIGTTIFWDGNRNGQQDGFEEGVPGVLVELYDSDDVLIASQHTGAEGDYLFTGLSPGTYRVEVVLDDGPLVGAELTADPDADGVPCWDPEAIGCNNSTVVNLAAGEAFLGADFGYDPPGATIGGLLWIDFNDNDAWDPGESGLAFIPIELYSNGTLVATTWTDDDGYYQFSGLPDGTYSVVVVTDDEDFPFPPGLSQTYDRDGVIDNEITDILVSGGVVDSVNGVSCTNCDLNNNFGYQYSGDNSLSGTIGMDDPDDPDGVPSESFFEGVTVFIYLWDDKNADGLASGNEVILVGTTTTDENGFYLFDNLPDGFDGYDNYVVSIAAPLSNLELTTTDESVGNPSFLVVNNANTQGNTVSAYQAVLIEPTVTNVDFAFLSTVEYDFGDLPLPYPTLLQDNGARHIVSDPPSLFLGETVETEPDGIPSVDADGDGDEEDGVEVLGIWQNGPNGGTVRIKVGAGEGRLLGFIDFDRSGAFDQAGELMLDEIVSHDGGLDGVYEFDFDIPAGSLLTTETTRLYGRFRLFPLSDFILFPQLAFQGEASNGEVEDYMWEFHAINGTVYWNDDEEPTEFSNDDTPQAGVLVRLYDDEENLIATTVSQLDGSYSFYGLPDGEYRIQIEEPDDTTLILVRDGTPIDGVVVEITGESLDERDFLLNHQPPVAAISGAVLIEDGEGAGWDDALAYPGVVVSLYLTLNGIVPDPHLLVGTAVTDEFGDYIFEELPPGNYLVVITPPKGTESLDDADGDGNGTDLIQVELEDSDIVEQDFLLGGPVPTLAVISGVRSRIVDGVAMISWDVALEMNTMGYYLERWTGAGWVRVSDSLIHADPFMPPPNTYEQADPGAPLASTQRYQIVELDSFGRLLFYGPYDLEIDGGEISYDTWAAGIDWGDADSDPDADPDGDGLTNWQEYLAGTDPLNPNSVLQIEDVVHGPDGVRLTWQSAEDRTYAIEIAPSLQDSFLAVRTGIDATPPENVETLPVTAPGAFFRVVVE